MRSGPGVAFGFALLCCFLSLVLASEIAPPIGATQWAAAPVSIARQPAGPRPPREATSRDEQVATILARPLFAPERRPFHAAPRLGHEGTIRLSGTILAGDTRTALFALGGDDKPAEREVAVGEGGQIGPFLVKLIGNGRVVVSRDGVAQVLAVHLAASREPASDLRPPPPPPPADPFTPLSVVRQQLSEIRAGASQ